MKVTKKINTNIIFVPKDCLNIHQQIIVNLNALIHKTNANCLACELSL